ncbi:MAG: ATP-binding protein [Candidatus Binatia bacterium]
MPTKRSPREHKPRIADRLKVARTGRFVGRAAELAMFRSALLAAEPSFLVLYLYGPGGVGKTTLLREFAGIATEHTRPIIQIDSRNLELSPSGFLAAVRHALELQEDGFAAIAAQWPERAVLLLDTYEILAPLDTWLRETFLPQLPAHSLVVIAGRTPPTIGWYTDIDWAELTHVISLSNLQREESQSYLTARGIPEHHHTTVQAFTHGHPLALSLVADVLAQGDDQVAFQPHKEPHIIRGLLDRFLHDVPSPTHRRALEICALAKTTTEALLAKILPEEDSFALFGWLCGLSFIEQGPHGLFPHDVVREVVDADLRWRNPERYRQLTMQIFTELSSRFVHASHREQRAIRRDILYMRRNAPTNKPYLDWKDIDDAYTEAASPQDHELILQMVHAHEGAQAVRIAQHWLRRQPQGFLVFRNSRNELFGFMATLTGVEHATPEDLAADPAIAATLQFVERRGPLRAGEQLVHLRFWMNRETYQTVSPTLTLTAINTTVYWLTTPRLSWSFTTMAHPDFMEPHFHGLGFQRAREADFVIGERRYGVFAHDWRVESPAAWQDRMTQQALTIDAPLEPEARSSRLHPSALVLSQATFTEAVRQALRHYTRPDALAENPLLHTRLLIETAETIPTPVHLQALLQEAAATLRTTPKDDKLYRVLKRTYLEPAPTQEQAADLLGLPFSTYRYRLTNGIARVAAWLWQKELNTT